MTTETKRSSREMDLTKGNLFWKIPLFALPMALTSVLQLLYTSVDLFTVSQFGGGGKSMSAVSSNGALINLLVTVFVSMSLGTNVAIGNAKGAGDREHAEKVMHTSIIFAIIAGVFVGAFGAGASRTFLVWMGTNEQILDLANDYLTIYFVGLPFLMVYNFASQTMRALGDSRRPLYILAASGLLNVIADYVFVKFFGWDVKGVAWATVLSEALSAVLSLLALQHNQNGFISLSWDKMKFDGDSFKEVLRLGLPAGIQGLAFSIPNVLIQSSIWTLGSSTVSTVDINTGSAASSQIEGYVFVLMDSCSAAAVAFTGQNYGAKKKENCRKSYWYSMVWMFIFWGVSTAAAMAFHQELFALFITEDGKTNVSVALENAWLRLCVMVLTYFLDGIMDVSSGYLRGMRYSTPPAIITIMGCTVTRLIFLTWIFPLPYFHNITWLYAAFPISWVLTDITYAVAIFIIEPKAFKKIAPEEKKETPAEPLPVK
jgi:putative MATE family efflux protein